MSTDSTTTSPLHRVRAFLHKLDEGKVSMQDADGIDQDLHELVHRLAHLQARYPELVGCELGPDAMRVLREIRETKVARRIS